MAQNYYQILGVPQTATEKEIKSAYRKLAVIEHPDKHGGAPEAVSKFQDINRAYETLRDAEKRREYDLSLNGGQARSAPTARPGPAATPPRKEPSGGASRTPPTAGRGGSDPLSDLLSGMMGGFGGATPPQARPTARPGASSGPTTATPTGSAPADTINVTLEEAYNGARRLYKIQTEKVCPDCRGSGHSQKGRSGLMPGTICLTCNGAGRSRRAEEVEVNIPRGVYEGAKLRVKGKGPLDANGHPVDLILGVHIKKDDRYALDGADILLDARVPYTVLALGGTVEIETPGAKRPLKIPAGTQSGQKLKLAGLGMPALGNRPQGDLYARVIADVPRSLSAEERRLLTDLARLRKDPID